MNCLFQYYSLHEVRKRSEDAVFGGHLNVVELSYPGIAVISFSFHANLRY